MCKKIILIDNGDVVLITFEKESADKRIYDETPIVSFYKLKTNGKFNLDWDIKTIKIKIKMGLKSLDLT